MTESLGHWQVDLPGTRVLLDEQGYRGLMASMAASETFADVIDSSGSTCHVIVGKVECITFVTPESVARYRAQARTFDRAINALDPEGDDAPPRPWESK